MQGLLVNDYHHNWINVRGTTLTAAGDSHTNHNRFSVGKAELTSKTIYYVPNPTFPN